MENYGLELVDKTKAQFLIEKMNNNDNSTVTDNEEMTLEKYSFKSNQPKVLKNRMTSRKSTAEYDSSQMKTIQDGPSKKPLNI